MGKYTSLAQKISEGELRKTSPSVVHPPPKDAARTPLRPNAVNAVIRCIHRLTEDSCAVCSGYVRWLIANEGCLRRAQAKPEATRREYEET
jgi:hypothetical protein